MPLFLGPARSRVQQTVVMSSPTGRELRSYVAWASGVAMMPDDEALIRTIDHALDQYFKNDKAWQKERAEFLAASAAAPARTNGSKTDGPAPPATAGRDETRVSASASAAKGG
jgi:hypothetical protein